MLMPVQRDDGRFVLPWRKRQPGLGSPFAKETVRPDSRFPTFLDSVFHLHFSHNTQDTALRLLLNVENVQRQIRIPLLEKLSEYALDEQ